MQQPVVNPFDRPTRPLSKEGFIQLDSETQTLKFDDLSRVQRTCRVFYTPGYPLFCNSHKVLMPIRNLICSLYIPNMKIPASPVLAVFNSDASLRDGKTAPVPAYSSFYNTAYNLELMRRYLLVTSEEIFEGNREKQNQVHALGDQFEDVLDAELRAFIEDCQKVCAGPARVDQVLARAEQMGFRIINMQEQFISMVLDLPEKLHVGPGMLLTENRTVPVAALSEQDARRLNGHDVNYYGHVVDRMATQHRQRDDFVAHANRVLLPAIRSCDLVQLRDTGMRGYLIPLMGVAIARCLLDNVGQAPHSQPPSRGDDATHG